MKSLADLDLAVQCIVHASGRTRPNIKGFGGPTMWSLFWIEAVVDEWTGPIGVGGHKLLETQPNAPCAKGGVWNGRSTALWCVASGAFKCV